VASISDIPSNLLRSDRKGDFIVWLAPLPIPSNSKRKLVYLWIEVTRTPFMPIDYAMVGLKHGL
jgi:hypothetical protein